MSRSITTARAKAAAAARHTSLADALFTGTQQRVLALLFGQPGRSFYATELIGLAAAGSGAVQRELARLSQSGLITAHAVGNQKHYRANAASPVFEELSAIVQKTFGLAEPLRAALAPLAKRITAAFVYGSVAKQQDTASSDVDLMVVSDSVSYPDLYATIESASQRLGRTVNPTIYTRKELTKRIKSGESFVTRVLEQPKVWLIGSEDDLAV
ncbi:MAG TPA: nucleotidyltransferase domain-containing protein [Burkholderiaceae bacterium]|nr:nucleotidyltransferase domain-containing protein [Burkholderiaceae bacterium]